MIAQTVGTIGLCLNMAGVVVAFYLVTRSPPMMKI